MVLAQIEGLFAAAFFVIAFIGWIINLINQAQTPKKPGNTPAPRPRREQVQQEIDQFLKQTRRPSNPERPSVEVVEADRPRRPPPPAQRRRNRKELWQEQVGKPGEEKSALPAASQSPSPAPPPKRKRPSLPQPATRSEPPRPSLSERHLQANISSAEVRRDLGEMPGNHLSAQVAKDLPSQITDQVTRDLGLFRATTPAASGEQAMAGTTGHRTTPAESLLRLLRSGRGIRDAILVNEILSKPPGLRSRS
jgi:hypothetical protein